EEMNRELKNRKIVEKAKGILMKQLNLPEETAYNKIRDLSMKKQMPLEKVAKYIILKYPS
ncbi:MAG: ANTAR domain-containing response regulator, partial [Bacillus sp. (in: firmicutes)]